MKKPPLRNPVTSGDAEGFYVVESGMVTVTATKGARGTKTGALSTTHADVLASMLLAELAIESSKR